jgi:hypothetical protein
MAKLGWFIGAVTLAASGIYVGVYLYRWEWNRALFVAIVFVALLVVMSTAIVLRRLSRLEHRNGFDGNDAIVMEHLRAAAPQHHRFAWLERSVSQSNIFITALLGGGVVVSGVAWVVDRLAAKTVNPGVDQKLAQQLRDLRFPVGGLVPDDSEVLAQQGPYRNDPELRLLLGPQHRR